MYVCMYVCVHGCMDAWMHGCMDAWMYGCMDAWMHGCMDACMHFFPKGAGRAIWPGVLGFMPHWVVSSVVVGHLEVRTVC